MLVSKITEECLTPDIIDRLLFEGLEDSGETADCIIVLGSLKAAKYRVPPAVEAYKLGRAKKLLLCGGAVRDFPNGHCTEAEDMYKAVVKLGVPETDIILESDSQNTVENLLYALIELQRHFCINNINRVLLVTAEYHMRRSISVARYLFPPHIEVLPCPAKDNHTRRNSWTDTPIGLERVRAEAMKIVGCVNNRLFPDFEI